MNTAYLIAVMVRDGFGARLLGIDVFSEASPTMPGDRRPVVIATADAETYEEARVRVLFEVPAWLEPKNNGGRAAR